MARGKRQRQRETRVRRETHAPGIRLVVQCAETREVLHIRDFIPEVSNGRFLSRGGGRQLKEAIARIMQEHGDVYVLLLYSEEVKR